jgi:hypothetical protein
MLIEFARRGIRPNLILFADTGGEKPETYRYMQVIRPFLAKVGFPDVIVVRYQPKWAAYKTLEEQCLHTGTLPSLASGGKSCSLKYKKEPQDKFVRGWLPARECWARGGKVVKAIGYDAGPADSRRTRYEEDEEYRYWYPLVRWGFDRRRCQEIILRAGLPVPMKSAGSTAQPPRSRRSSGCKSTIPTCWSEPWPSSATPRTVSPRSRAWAAASPGVPTWLSATTFPSSGAAATDNPSLLPFPFSTP